MKSKKTKEVEKIVLFINGTNEELTKRCIDAGFEPLVFGNDYDNYLIGNYNCNNGCVVGVKK